MNKKFEERVRVRGKGSSKRLACNQALSKIQSEILKKYKDHLIIRIEPIDVEIVKVEEEKYTEKFLFFFLKREKSTFKVELDVNVSLFLMEI